MASEVKALPYSRQTSPRQAISGVPSDRESHLETVYPSISSAALGRLIGSICDSIPLRIGGIPLSCLLFALPLAPLALAGYLSLKVVGQRYIVTNRVVKIQNAMGQKLVKQVSLSDIEDIVIDVNPGQAFYHAGDLLLLNSRGDTLLTLPGVTRPERLRRLILDTKDARVRNDASLRTIQARTAK